VAGEDGRPDAGCGRARQAWRGGRSIGYAWALGYRLRKNKRSKWAAANSVGMEKNSGADGMKSELSEQRGVIRLMRIRSRVAALPAGW